MAGLADDDLQWGLKAIVGKWKVDYVVNFFSNNLEHIPPTEFKSKDGKDFSELTFEFFEDHTCKLSNPGTGVEEKGTWEQTGRYAFSYTFDKLFGDVPKEALKDVTKLEYVDMGLVFGIFFLSVKMKKVEEGHITKPLDIGDIVPTEEENKKLEIVGRWRVYKAMTMVDDDFGMHTLAEAQESLKKQKEAGDDVARQEMMLQQSFGAVVEFKADHKVHTYMPLPDDVPKEEIDKAVASGEVTLVDGMIADDNPADWKFVKGDYYYDTRETREVFGEPVSAWDKITPDSEGHIDWKTWILERIK